MAGHEHLKDLKPHNIMVPFHMRWLEWVYVDRRLDFTSFLKGDYLRPQQMLLFEFLLWTVNNFKLDYPFYPETFSVPL